MVRSLIGARRRNEINDAFIGKLTFLNSDKTAMFRFLFEGKYFAAFFRRIALGDILTTTTLVHVGEIKAQ